jgi:DTW domain-containing protein YfiP
MLSTQSPFYCAHCIHCRLPEQSCICGQIKSTKLPFKIILCCHSKEWQRNDNTGQWAVLSSQDIERYRWHRKPELITPALDLEVLSLKQQSLADSTEGGHFLLFPAEDSQPISQLKKRITHLWVIDGTWQEAQKMLKQSPWLQNLPKISITSATSQFVLRRNQQGLSTMEAIEWAIRDSELAHKSIHNAPHNSADTLKFNFNLAQNQLLDLLR